MKGEVSSHQMSTSRSLILVELKKNQPATIDELMEIIKLSKTAVRSHLSQLEELGWVSRTRLPTTSAGRPKVVYRLTEQAAAAFPVDDELVLRQLIAFLHDRGLQDVVSDFFNAVWGRRWSDFCEEISKLDPLERGLTPRLEIIERLLERDNFMPSITRLANDRIRVKECNCPLATAIGVTREPCRLEKSFLEKATGGKVVKQYIARQRGESCHFDIAFEHK